MQIDRPSVARLMRFIVLATLSVLMTGCATKIVGMAASHEDLQNYNRAFLDGDRVVLFSDVGQDPRWATIDLQSVTWSPSGSAEASAIARLIVKQPAPPPDAVATGAWQLIPWKDAPCPNPAAPHVVLQPRGGPSAEFSLSIAHPQGPNAPRSLYLMKATPLDCAASIETRAALPMGGQPAAAALLPLAVAWDIITAPVVIVVVVGSHFVTGH